MARLEDIGQAQWSLQIGKTTIEGGGLSAHDILYLMDRFPLVGVLFGSTEGITENLEPAKMIKTFPDAACSAFAIATGYERGDKKGETAAAKLTLINQVRLLQKIIDTTIGEEGVGPFVAMLNNLTKSITVPTPLEATESSAPASKSPPQSSAALHLELPPKKHGPIHRVG